MAPPLSVTHHSHSEASVRAITDVSRNFADSLLPTFRLSRTKDSTHQAGDIRQIFVNETQRLRE